MERIGVVQPPCHAAAVSVDDEMSRVRKTLAPPSMPVVGLALGRPGDLRNQWPSYYRPSNQTISTMRSTSPMPLEGR